MSEQGSPPPDGGASDRPPAKRVAKKAAARPATGGAAGGGAADDGPASTVALGLIVATVLVGLVIFFTGIRHDSSVQTAGGADSNATTSTTQAVDRNAAPSTTRPEQAGTITTPPSTKAPADVKVYVVNSADPSKVIAGPMADELTSLGYTVVGRVDGPVSSTSQVWYIPGYEGDAKAIATQIGFGTSAVAPLPDPAPVVVPAGTNVVVSVGTDKAADVQSGNFGGTSSGSSSSSSSSGSGSSATTTTSTTR